MKPVILQSDGCGYQNRNPVWFYDDLILSMGNKEYQYNKSLVREHRHIEFNSIYSTMDTILEKKETLREIFFPSQYVQWTKEARKVPFHFHYRAQFLNYSFIRNYSLKETIEYDSIRLGRNSNDIVFHDLRAFKQDPNGIIEFKTKFDDYLPLSSQPKIIQVIPKCLPLHTERLKNING